MLLYGVGAAYADFMDNAFFSLVNDVHSNELSALIEGRPEVACVVRWVAFSIAILVREGEASVLEGSHFNLFWVWADVVRAVGRGSERSSSF